MKVKIEVFISFMKFKGWTTNVQKTPLVFNMKVYIKLVHNPGRDDCTCMNFKKEKEVKCPKQQALL